MAKSLVIVESPSKAKTINKYLGKDYKVVASVGHIKNLPKSKISIDFDNGYDLTYETIPGKEKIIEELKSLSKTSDKVYLATDPDREGEAIAFDIAKEINGKNDNMYRVLFNEITKKGIEDGISNPMRIDKKLVSSQQASRVQSVALKLICEREEEIRKFVPREYWSILADFKDRDKNKVFESKLIQKNNVSYKFNGEVPKITNEAESDDIINDLKNKHFKVADIS